MKTNYFKNILVLCLLGICTLSFSQKIEHEITIKGEIENIEEIVPYITENTCLQIVEYKENFTMIVSNGTLTISSEFPMLKIPKDGKVEYKIKNLKYDTKYCIAIQMLDPEYSNVSKVLRIKYPNMESPVITFNISKSEGKINAPTDLNLGKFSIPK
jgi:hypothetical protein